MTKLGNIVGKHIKYDMFANNVAQFGYHVSQQIQVKKMLAVCLYMLKKFSRTFVARCSGKGGERNMRKSLEPIATSTSLAAKCRLNQRRKG